MMAVIDMHDQSDEELKTLAQHPMAESGPIWATTRQNSNQRNSPLNSRRLNTIA